MHLDRWICALAIAASAAMARAQHVLARVDGSQNFGQLGASIAMLDDLDGDGVAELAIGAPGTQSVVVVSGATGAMLYAVVAGGYGDFGRRVRAIGDCDGDGLADFIVPSWRENGYAGACRVYSGVDGTLLYAYFGATDDRLGRDADGVGDLDGDGRADFIVGADGEQHTGVARVYSGATGAVIYTIASAVYGGLDLGAGVGGIGDVDGDSIPDFAVGIPAGGGPGGRVLVFSGASGSLLFAIVEPALDQWTFGRTIATAGDLDGDGMPDILVGDTHFEAYDGSVIAYSGVGGARLYQVFGSGCEGSQWSSSDPDFGNEIVAVGDLDHDGVGDFGVGGLNEARVFSGANGALLRQFHEPTAIITGDTYSTGVGAVADLDGDGTREVVVGWRLASTVRTIYAGRVTWYADDVYPPAGSLLALGDGSGAACPCGNTAQAQAGCANSTGFGAELRSWGSTSMAQDTNYLQAARLPSHAILLLYCGTQPLGGGAGVPFGDGLRGAGGATKRFGAQHACGDGGFVWGPGLALEGHWLPGDTRYFQVWYRDPSGPCGSTFNFSNAVAMTFTP
jgi:hypothetical protein